MLSSSPQFHLRTRRCAFSLTELLIVIGIIVVIIGLSISGVVRAREAAQSTKCVGKLRTIYAGLSGFINDRGYYPGVRVTTRPTTWHHALEPFITGGAIPPSGSPAAPWARCPSNATTADGPLGYSYNQYFGNIPPNASDASSDSVFNAYWQIRPTQVEAPSTKIVIGDGRDDGVVSGFSRNSLRNSTTPSDPLHPRRHPNKSGNFLFADGHVERLTPLELTNLFRAKPSALKPF